MQWNRSDIAKTDIFTGEEEFKPYQLANLMEMALIQNKPEFVELLLENGLNLKSFLTVIRLCFLYNSNKVSLIYLNINAEFCFIYFFIFFFHTHFRYKVTHVNSHCFNCTKKSIVRITRLKCDSRSHLKAWCVFLRILFSKTLSHVFCQPIWTVPSCSVFW